MTDQPTLEILAFTDPVCTWCWGVEPVLRALRIGYGDQLRIRPVMGGLVEDIRTFYDHANAIGGDPEEANVAIVAHWLDASARHGMPVRTEGFRLFSAETVSTYPQNIAYKAAELTDPERAPRYLRRLREASATEARETGRREVLIELAAEVGLDLATFIGRLEDGSAEYAFRADLALTRRAGVHGFPSFQLVFGERTLSLRGYQGLANMRAVIESLSEGVLRWRSPRGGAEGLLELIHTLGRMAPVELATILDLSAPELERHLVALEEAGSIRRVTVGNGCLWEVSDGGAGCDPAAGLCAA
ncbi:DSBA oxidoreductase [Marichromatium purpuratum 984]|uniref:DSBA oxidoreductase n=1 Tax=Marichromatium purpuratum 984 TaxID=765910 RepID=W0E072_MARPU|nr:thioredoxin [Marichromatium purpuratum]AHF04245.1 DSBA oxidoreductase [Marichromatium purpuratum 984]